MLKRIVIMFLIGLLTNVAIFANENKKEKEFAEKVKTEIIKLGTGTDANVKVKLKNGKKIKGYITEIKSDGFVVMDKKSGINIEVGYSQTKQVKGNNLSNGVKLALGIGLIVGIIAIIIVAGKSG